MSQPNPPGYRPPMPQYGKSQLTGEQRQRQRIIIGGVLGCFGMVLLGLVVAGVVAFRAAKGAAYTGAVDRGSIQQQVGSDVPLYPNGEVDEATTRGLLSGVGLMGKVMESLGGQAPSGMALMTDDTEEAVMEYYRRELPSLGWQESQVQRTLTGNQYTFIKENAEILTIQVQESRRALKKRAVIIMRMPIGIAPKESKPQPGGPFPTGDFPQGGATAPPGTPPAPPR